MSKRIGLFGGTFDPVHNGHVAIVESFLNSQYIDELWVLLTPFPPHKQNKEHISYNDRKYMLDLAFKDHEKVIICTVEQDLPKPSYTIRTLEFLQDKYIDHNFFLCIGEDSLGSFVTWKDHSQILERCDLLVAERPQATHDQVDEEILEKAHFVNHSPVKVSSTTIRSLIKAGKETKHLLPSPVYKYIIKNALYQ